MHRFLVALAFGIYFVVSYLGVQYIARTWGSPIILKLPGEENIPFLPAMILIYSASYIFFPLLFILLQKKGNIVKAIWVFLITSIIHYAFFVFLPVQYTLRPDLTQYNHFAQTPFISLINLYYNMDAPLNTFPSLHVSYAFLTYFFIRRYRPDFKNIALIMAIAISVSTLFVKQHYVLDVVVALPITWLMNRLIIEKRFGVVKKELIPT